MAEVTAIDESEIQKVKETEDDPTVAQSRAKIINSILANGLKTGRNLRNEAIFHLPSADTSANIGVEGCVIQSSNHVLNPKDFMGGIRRAINSDGRSILPVLIERAYDGKSGLGYFYNPFSGRGEEEEILPDEKRSAQERMFSSMLVIYKLDNNETESGETIEIDEKDLVAKNIAYVVIPAEVYKQYQENVLAKEIKVPLKVVGNTKIKIFNLKDSIVAPNYEQAVTEISEELGSPIWIHGVRLPTEEDLEEERYRKEFAARKAQSRKV